jgi:hypothetical protein
MPARNKNRRIFRRFLSGLENLFLSREKRIQLLELLSKSGLHAFRCHCSSRSGLMDDRDNFYFVLPFVSVKVTSVV